jgi:hypothetical protein
MVSAAPKPMMILFLNVIEYTGNNRLRRPHKRKMEGQTYSVREGGACILTAFAVSKLLDMECALLNTAGKFSAKTADSLSFLDLVDVPESHIICGNNQRPRTISPIQ